LFLTFQEEWFRGAEEGESTAEEGDWAADEGRAIGMGAEEDEVVGGDDEDGNEEVVREVLDLKGREECCHQAIYGLRRARDHFEG